MSETFVQQLTQQGADVSKFSGFTQARSTSVQADKLTEEFQKTGAVTQDMRDFALRFGQALTGSTAQIGETLKQLQSQAQAEYRAAASALGIEVGKLQTAVETEIGKLQTGLETALDAVGTKLNDQFEDSRFALIGQLEKVDTDLSAAVGDAKTALVGILTTIETHLTAALGTLKTDLTTAVNGLTAAIAGIKFPEAPAAPSAPSQPAPSPEPEPDYSDPNEYWRRYSQPGFAMAAGGQGIVRKPTVFLAGESGPERFRFEPLRSALAGFTPELRQVTNPSMGDHLIAPALMAQIRFSFAKLEASQQRAQEPRIVDNSKHNTVTMPISYYGGGEDPFRLRREMDRFKADLLNSLA